MLLLVHYLALSVAAFLALIPDSMIGAALFLPLALVPLEEVAFWRKDVESPADYLVFGLCGLIICVAFALNGLGYAIAAWVSGAAAILVWTLWRFWRLMRSR
jgi:hypothetical protein